MASEPDSETPGAAQAAAARDRARFEEDALAHAEHLYRIALRLTGSPQTAEDLVQETYLRAFRAWQSYYPGNEPRRLACNHHAKREHGRASPPEPAPALRAA